MILLKYFILIKFKMSDNIFKNFLCNLQDFFKKNVDINKIQLKNNEKLKYEFVVPGDYFSLSSLSSLSSFKDKEEREKEDMYFVKIVPSYNGNNEIFTLDYIPSLLDLYFGSVDSDLEGYKIILLKNIENIKIVCTINKTQHFSYYAKSSTEEQHINYKLYADNYEFINEDNFTPNFNIKTWLNKIFCEEKTNKILKDSNNL
jgi:hypothetical protein